MYGTGDSEAPDTIDLPQWTGAPADLAESAQPAMVLVAFPPVARQSRLSVAFRLILAIPHAVVLYVLNFAATIVVILGWFGALFLGRLPRFAANFLSGYVRWQARFYAYVFLLTDVYPPLFSMGEDDYPVQLTIQPGRLNRLAVLFRIILIIPAAIIAAAAAVGAFTIAAFVVWLIVLIKGQMPASVHAAWTAIQRYATRANAYAYMLTSAYPNGLYGERPADTVAPSWTVPGEPVPDAATAEQALPAEESAPAAGQATTGEPAPPATEPAPAATEPAPAAEDFAVAPAEEPALVEPAPPTRQPTATSPWELVLSGGARNLMTIFLVLGVLFAAGGITGNVLAMGKTLTRVEALRQTRDDTQPLNAVLGTYSSKVQSCGQQFSCVTALDRTTGAAFATYATKIGAIAMPDGTASSDAAAVADTANQLSGIFDRLGAATTPAQYEHVTSAAVITTDIEKLSRQYANLQLALGARTSA